MKKYISGEEAVKAIKPGDRVFVHCGAATPHHLLKNRSSESSTRKRSPSIAHANHCKELRRAAFDRFHTDEFERTLF